MITLKNISKTDAEVFWALRLEGLLLEPESFSSSYEESVRETMEAVKERIGETEDNYILGAFDESNRLVGMARFGREQSLKLRHKGGIMGVYVTAEFRRRGIGRMLAEEIIHRSKQLNGLIQIQLSVTKTNVAAVKLYQSLGFETYGVEKKALVVNDQYLDEELMALYLCI